MRENLIFFGKTFLKLNKALTSIYTPADIEQPITMALRSGHPKSHSTHIDSTVAEGNLSTGKSIKRTEEERWDSGTVPRVSYRLRLRLAIWRGNFFCPNMNLKIFPLVLFYLLIYIYSFMKVLIPFIIYSRVK